MFLKFTLSSKQFKITKLIGVLKVNTYGNDSLVIAKKLEELSTDMIAVAYTSEGIYLKKNNLTFE